MLYVEATMRKILALAIILLSFSTVSEGPLEGLLTSELALFSDSYR